MQKLVRSMGGDRPHLNPPLPITIVSRLFQYSVHLYLSAAVRALSTNYEKYKYENMVLSMLKVFLCPKCAIFHPPSPESPDWPGHLNHCLARYRMLLINDQ